MHFTKKNEKIIITDFKNILSTILLNFRKQEKTTGSASKFNFIVK